MDHEDGDGDGAGLGGGVDGDSGGGMEKTSGGDSSGVSPLRPSPAAAFYLLFRDFVFLRRPPSGKHRGTIFIVVLGQDETRGTKIDGIGATRAKGVVPHGQVQGPRGALHLPVGWAPGLQFQPIAFASKILNRAL